MFLPLLSCPAPGFGHFPATPPLGGQSPLAEGKAVPVGNWPARGNGGNFSAGTFVRGQKCRSGDSGTFLFSLVVVLPVLCMMQARRDAAWQGFPSNRGHF